MLHQVTCERMVSGLGLNQCTLKVAALELMDSARLPNELEAYDSSTTLGRQEALWMVNCSFGVESLKACRALKCAHILVLRHPAPAAADWLMSLQPVAAVGARSCHQILHHSAQ